MYSAVMKLCTLSVVVCLLVCRPGFGQAEQTHQVGGENLRPYNVLLYVLDTTRADHFGMHGYERNTTPHMDALAKEGMAWSNCIASSTHTMPGTSSILTGVSTESHRASRFTSALSLSWPTLPEILKDYGYSSKMITSNSVLWSESRQINNRFDEFAATVRPDQKLTDELIDFLDRDHQQPFFLLAQPYACHAPYEAPAPYDELFVDDEYYGQYGDVPAILPSPLCEGGMPEGSVIDGITSIDWYIAQYDGLLAYMDTQVKQMMDALEARGLRDNTLVIITADHGEMLGDHNHFFCHRTHYQGNTHVPLMVFLPRDYERQFGSRQGEWHTGNATHVDLAPTILDVLNVDRPQHYEGSSLLNIPDPLYSMGHTIEERTLHIDNMKVIHRGDYLVGKSDSELYNLEQDPDELNDLAESNPELLDALGRILLSETRALRRSTIPPLLQVGTFYRQSMDLGMSLINEGLVQDIPPFKYVWRIEPATAQSDNGVLHAFQINGASHPNPQRLASVIGFTAEPENPYSASVRVKLRKGRFLFATSAVYSEVAEDVHAMWGYMVDVSVDRIRLLRLRPGNQVDLLDSRPFAFVPRIWHTIALKNDKDVLKVFIDGFPVLSGDPGKAPEFFYGTTYFGTFEDTDVFFDDLRHWREDIAYWVDP